MHTVRGAPGPSEDRCKPPSAPEAIAGGERSPQATFAWCPMCDGPLAPEHAHFRCAECGWRDSCCD